MGRRYDWCSRLYRRKVATAAGFLARRPITKPLPPGNPGGLFRAGAFSRMRENRQGDIVRGKRFESTGGPATLGTTATADLLLRT